MPRYEELRPGGIVVRPDRLRVLRPELVGTLAASFVEIGQLQAIIVARNERNGYDLIAGRHRLEAAIKLKWETIKCDVVDDGLTADAAVLREIDENLKRGDLSTAERGVHEAARKVVYLRLHPETEHGANQHTKRSRKDCDSSEPVPEPAERYTKVAAKESGRSERSVQLDINRGNKAVGDDLTRIVGTSLDEGKELDALAKLREKDPEAAKDLIDRAANGEKISAKTELKKLNRAEREQALGEKQIALPGRKYGVIVADPEWRFEPWSRDTGLDRAADNYYPTNPIEIIAERPVSTIAADDCVLFLWATVPMLQHALAVMVAWGFEYRTNFTWAKDRIGTGYWNRNNHEHLLVGVRGNPPAPAPGTQWESVIAAPVGKHSAKPERCLELIEEYFPTLPKIELNRRGLARAGWDAWGNEALPQAAE